MRSSGAPAGFLRSEKIQTVAVGATAPPEIVFALQKAPIIRGVTVDENDKPFEARFTVGDDMIQRGSGKDGKWQYEPSDNDDLTFGGGSDDDGYFEVIGPKRLDTPVRGPITLQMRKKPWQTLAGRAVTPEGAPVAGVKIEASFVVMFSDSSGRGATSSATTDAEGRFILEKLRDSRDLKVSGKGVNYQFVSGGAITKKGADWTVSDLVFAPLAAKIEGTTEAGAFVTTAGRETRADDAGHFAFESLPAGQNLIYAAKAGRGGSALSNASPLVIALQKPELQGRDETLAREIWAETLRDAADPDASGLKDWLASPSFDDAMKAAQKSGDSSKIAEVAARWKSGDSLELLKSGLDLLTEPNARTDAYLRAALATGDAALGRRARNRGYDFPNRD